MERNIKRLPENLASKIVLRNSFIGNDEKTSFDVLFKDEKVTLINMDIEGAEMFVLASAKDIIKKHRPVLAICAYHKPEDIYEILHFVKTTVDSYSYHLAKYREYSPKGLYEWVLYCVPTERDYKA